MRETKAAVLLRRHVAGSLVILAGMGACLALILIAPSMLPRGTVPVADAAPDCSQADTATVAALKPVMDRRDGQSSLVVAANFRLVADARQLCGHGATERALKLYGMAGQSIARYQAGVPIGYGE